VLYLPNSFEHSVIFWKGQQSALIGYNKNTILYLGIDELKVLLSFIGCERQGIVVGDWQNTNELVKLQWAETSLC